MTENPSDPNDLATSQEIDTAIQSLTAADAYRLWRCAEALTLPLRWKLRELIVEDIQSTSDDDLLREAQEDGHDVEHIAGRVRFGARAALWRVCARGLAPPKRSGTTGRRYR